MSWCIWGWLIHEDFIMHYVCWFQNVLNSLTRVKQKLFHMKGDIFTEIMLNATYLQFRNWMVYSGILLQKDAIVTWLLICSKMHYVRWGLFSLAMVGSRNCFWDICHFHFPEFWYVQTAFCKMGLVAWVQCQNCENIVWS